MAKFIPHPRLTEINWVVGYIDYHGAVQAEILFGRTNRIYLTHKDLFPDAMLFNPWRWSKSNGIEAGADGAGDVTDEEVESVRRWLFKHGCLNRWELEDDEIEQQE